MPVEEDTFTLRSPAPPLYLPQARHPDHVLGAKMGMLSCLILAGELWGEATRWGCDVRRHGTSPMSPDSEFARFQAALPDWQAVSDRYHDGLCVDCADDGSRDFIRGFSIVEATCKRVFIGTPHQ